MNTAAQGDGLRTTWATAGVAVALAATLGLMLQRHQPLPPTFSLAATVACLAGWSILRKTRESRLAVLLLLGAVAGVAACYGHYRLSGITSGELSRLATIDGTPVCLQGEVVTPPYAVPGSDNPLQTIPRPDATTLTLGVRTLSDGPGSRPVTGNVLAYLPGTVQDLFPGDEVELRGRLTLPLPPGNPGEADRLQELHDQGVAAVLSVPATADAVRLLARRWPTTFHGWLGRLHQACKETLHDRLSTEPALATALLLGDGSGLDRDEWDKYLRTGVVHALAISGQHLVVLATFLLLLRRLTPLRMRTAVALIGLVLVAYALLTGGRPPALRAAWVAVALCGTTWLRRPLLPLPTLALAWLGIAVVNPADLFQTGCQLSFLAVFLLHGVLPCIGRAKEEEDPLDALVRESRPLVVQGLGIVGGWVGHLYLANAIVWLGITPLLAARYHMVSPAALLIGPPVTLLTSAGLITGFLLLLTASVLGPLASPFAWLTDLCLGACRWLVDLALWPRWDFSFYLADLPEWWLVGFYAWLFITVLGLPRLQGRIALGRTLALGVLWMLFGLSFGLGGWRTVGPRVTFVSVGHGGCTVMETAAGRVLVYDAGAMNGPDITRRVIAPFLWSRGHRRVDEVFISHADLDHFNGLKALVERFPVGRVNLTPTFADRRKHRKDEEAGEDGVTHTLAALRQRKVPQRVLKAGDAESVDDFRLDVLHPPPDGPEGPENARSLVLHVRVDGFSLLLTGDLEQAGLDRVLALRPPDVGLLMAPHHGSRTANSSAFAAWARPRLVVSCQGRPRGVQSPAPVYEAVGAEFLTTWEHGALTLTRDGVGFRLDAYRTKRRWDLGPAPGR